MPKPNPIAVIDYGAGNLESVVRAFARAGAHAQITQDADTTAQACAIVLPGVGSFDAAMSRLRETGIDQVLRDRVETGNTPILGICLGFQMFGHGSEEGTGSGFGWLDADSRRFQSKPDTPIKIPHIGWNDVQPRGESPLFAGLKESDCFYFAHSFYVDVHLSEDVVAQTEYGRTFAAVAQRGPLVGVQFHPEKSHDNGARFLRNFLEMNGLA